MVESVEVILTCCGSKKMVQFRHAEAPALPSNQFRKNVTCSACKKMVIITMTKELGGGTQFEQEVLGS